jgi:hypothetical protein
MMMMGNRNDRPSINGRNRVGRHPTWWSPKRKHRSRKDCSSRHHGQLLSLFCHFILLSFDGIVSERPPFSWWFVGHSLSASSIINDDEVSSIVVGFKVVDEAGSVQLEYSSGLWLVRSKVVSSETQTRKQHVLCSLTTTWKKAPRKCAIPLCIWNHCDRNMSDCQGEKTLYGSTCKRIKPRIL